MGNGTIASVYGSTAMGVETKAYGNYSTAMGISTTATGYASTAMGRNTLASGDTSTAMGYFTIASGNSSTAMGFQDTAFGFASTAMGYRTSATESYSVAMGYFAKASGNASFAMGNQTSASGNFSTAMGERTVANANGSLAIGRFNVITVQSNVINCTDTIFQIGNGIGDNNRKDALWVTRNGNMTLNGVMMPSKGVVCPSDIRLKKHIKPLGNVLSNINHIQPISYYFKDGETYSAGHQIGFSAQEIEKEFPELVNKNAKGFLAVNYSQMTAVAIQAIKEQQGIIKKQDEKITQLEKKLEKLEKILTSK
jgi:hypothetical protein